MTTGKYYGSPLSGGRYFRFGSVSDGRALDTKVAAAGGAKLLRKPFSNDALLAAVDVALRSKARDAS